MSCSEEPNNKCLLVGDNVSSKILRGLMGAANMAIKSELNCRHGSVLISGNRIISSGYNQSRSKYGNRCTSCIHAEVDCIHNFVKNVCRESFTGKIKSEKWRRVLNKATIYVVRVPRVNNSLEYLNYSKPCSECYKIIKGYGIKNIVYSDADNEVAINKISNLEGNHVTKGNQRIAERTICD